MLEDLVKKSRSYRRFCEEEAISADTLKELVELARLSPSASNLQPLKYILSSDPEKNAKIFPCLAWAGYLEGWGGPAEGERPAAYIIIVGDKEIKKNFGCDYGIVAQSMLLGATEKGLGGCMLGLIDRDKLRKALNVPARFRILLVVALGKPSEEVVIDKLGPDGNIKYWRDDKSVHHVPKRSLKDIIVE
ncbi:MAG: nitroreductase family protein [Candidatus Saganbacteria bacterium]|nr:nitroreductase family protein [Candidatus Saganbacteria bacterium]